MTKIAQNKMQKIRIGETMKEKQCKTHSKYFK